MTVTLEEADLIADGTLAEGRARGANPLTVVVLDPGGHPVVVKRSDNSGILRFEIAFGKAYGALGFGLPSRTLFARAADNPNFFAAVSAAAQGRIVPNPGGVLLRDGSGRIVGAVGVSGDTGDVDESCAVAGVLRTGLVPDTGGKG